MVTVRKWRPLILEEPTEEPLLLRLIELEGTDEVCLVAVNKEGVILTHILNINSSGKLYLETGVRNDLGLILGDRNRIVVRE